MAEGDAPSQTYIIFEVAGTAFGVPSSEVRHIEMVETITPVPDALPFVDGVVFSRGEIIPAVNLRVRFGLDKIPHDLRTRIVVVKVGERTVGFIADSAREFVRISTRSIIDPPEEIAETSGRYLRGIAKLGERLVLLVKPEAILKQGEEDELPLFHETVLDRGLAETD